ncbi:hypothetical protein CVT25_009897 [Psilocybe cyanescens]|uniref:Uncharacterized protein n=1 Tax=Psilocybe cyanescens TaxID=93625 RepID=A0A409XTI3_PSICY|nr:hypothetical protein CVT25_009897 [Psilocybe cyanescens]
MYFRIAFLFFALASSKELEVTGSAPMLEQHDDAIRMSKGTSYITAISILGSVVVLLFLVKWAYVSRRRKNQRNGPYASQFVWRDEFSASSLPLWGEHSSNSKKYVRSALLVGLFGSPSWETRYSAIADKISGNRPQSGQGSLIPTGSRRYKSISVNSDQNPCMYSPELASGVKPRHHADWHRHKLTALLKNAELSLPSLAMRFDSGTKRSSFSEEAHSPEITSWRNEILSGEYMGYPSGLCIGRRSRPDFLKTQASIVLQPSDLSSTRDSQKLDSMSHTVEQRTGSYMLSRHSGSEGEGTGLEIIQLAEHFKSPKTATTNFFARVTASGAVKNCSEGFLIDGSLGAEDHAPLLSNHQDNLQPTSDWDSDIAEITASTRSGETLDGSYGDYCYSGELSCILPVKPRITIPPPRERVWSRSPKVGPSPLRRMFLPTDESPQNDPDSSESPLPFLMAEQNNDNQRKWEHKHGEIDQSLSIPFTSSLGTTQAQPRDPECCSPDTPGPCVRESSRRQRSLNAKQERSDDNLLDFLEELVQETSEWDPDMFIDNNFKVMIDGSKSFDGCTPIRTRRKKSTPLRRCRMPYIYLEDIPEVDSKKEGVVWWI